MNVGFWGAGVMGSGIGRNLLRNGHEVVVYSRSLDRARAIACAGKGRATDRREDLAHGDALFTCLARPQHVEAGMLGEGGLYALMKPGSVHVECSTIGPDLADKLAGAAKARGIGYVQATLGKTPAMAEKAEEPIFVGGEPEAVKKAWPLLEQVGKPENVGGANASCAIKLISNLIGMTNIVVLGEGLRIGRAAGMDMRQLLKLLADTGAHSFQMDARGPSICDRAYEPARFALTLALKDVALGADMAHGWKVPVPLFDKVRELFARGVEQGLSDADCAAVAEVLDK
ncbi:MAG: NAD(P)-dependent oxidoreductase [Desulfovibrio sp.]|nr:NAD(P)-dependent oxidoreductase [Desulfovibrio sp.]